MSQFKNVFKIISIIVGIVNAILICVLLYPIIAYATGHLYTISNFSVLPIILGSIDAAFALFVIIYFILRKLR